MYDDDIIYTIDSYELLPRIRASATALVDHCSREPNHTFPTDLVQKIQQLLPFLDDLDGRESEIVMLARVLISARRIRIKALKILPRELARLLDGLTPLIEYSPLADMA